MRTALLLRLNVFHSGAVPRLEAQLTDVEGDAPTKDVPLHSALYEVRGSAGSVVHFRGVIASFQYAMRICMTFCRH